MLLILLEEHLDTWKLLLVLKIINGVIMGNSTEDEWSMVQSASVIPLLLLVEKLMASSKSFKCVTFSVYVGCYPISTKKIFLTKSLF